MKRRIAIGSLVLLTLALSAKSLIQKEHGLPIKADAAQEASASAPPTAPQAEKLTTGSSPEDFATLLNQTLESLPTIADLRELSEEELHGTPTLIIEAGRKLGKIAQAVHDQPELAPASREFYTRCTQDVKIDSAIRAVCYSHVRESSTADQEVVSLADEIPRDPT